MLFLEFASVGPMLGQADISTLAQRRTNGWITIGMFTGVSEASMLEYDRYEPCVGARSCHGYLEF